jgi:hypothetical protein
VETRISDFNATKIDGMGLCSYQQNYQSVK